MLLVFWHEPHRIGSINHNAPLQYCISRPNINHLHSHVVRVAMLLSEIHLGLTLWFPIDQSWTAWAAGDRYEILRFTFRCAKYLSSEFCRLDWILDILFILGAFWHHKLLRRAKNHQNFKKDNTVRAKFFFYLFFSIDHFRGKFDSWQQNRKQASHTKMTQVMGLWDLHTQFHDRKSGSKFRQITQHVLPASKWPKMICNKSRKICLSRHDGHGIAAAQHMNYGFTVLTKNTDTTPSTTTITEHETYVCHRSP